MLHLDTSILSKKAFFFRQPEARNLVRELLAENPREAKSSLEQELKLMAIALCDLRQHPQYPHVTRLMHEKGIDSLAAAWEYVEHLTQVGEHFDLSMPHPQRPKIFVPSQRDERVMREACQEVGYKCGGYDTLQQPQCDAELVYNIYFGYLRRSEEMIEVIHQLLWQQPREGAYYIKLDVDKAEEIIRKERGKTQVKAVKYLEYLCNHFWQKGKLKEI